MYEMSGRVPKGPTRAELVYPGSMTPILGLGLAMASVVTVDQGSTACRMKPPFESIRLPKNGWIGLGPEVAGDGIP